MALFTDGDNKEKLQELGAGIYARDRVFYQATEILEEAFVFGRRRSFNSGGEQEDQGKQAEHYHS
eukprot:7388457-Prorocentrum_lima.AAC.1